VRECCELGPDVSVAKKELRAACRDYFKEQGEDVPNAWTLAEWLAAQGVRQTTRRFRGIRLLEGVGE
jgi:hypothetical protein